MVPLFVLLDLTVIAVPPDLLPEGGRKGMLPDGGDRLLTIVTPFLFLCAGDAPTARLPETVLDGPALVRGLFVCAPPELVPLEARPVGTLRDEGTAFRDLFWAPVPFDHASYIARSSGVISDFLILLLGQDKKCGL